MDGGILPFAAGVAGEFSCGRCGADALPGGVSATPRGTLPRRQIRARRNDPSACDKAEVKPMGFLDKAKQLADQAQQKLEQ
jgi:hypothetical protein